MHFSIKDHSERGEAPHEGHLFGACCHKLKKFWKKVNWCDIISIIPTARVWNSQRKQKICICTDHESNPLTRLWEIVHAKFPDNPLKFCWCDKKYSTQNSTHFSYKAVKSRFVVLCVLLSGVLRILTHQSDSHAYLQFGFSIRPKLCGEPWKYVFLCLVMWHKHRKMKPNATILM